jgi:hypothetical protein
MINGCRAECGWSLIKQDVKTRSELICIRVGFKRRFCENGPELLRYFTFSIRTLPHAVIAVGSSVLLTQHFLSTFHDAFTNACTTAWHKKLTADELQRAAIAVLRFLSSGMLRSFVSMQQTTLRHTSEVRNVNIKN